MDGGAELTFKYFWKVQLEIISADCDKFQPALKAHKITCTAADDAESLNWPDNVDKPHSILYHLFSANGFGGEATQKMLQFQNTPLRKVQLQGDGVLYNSSAGPTMLHHAHSHHRDHMLSKLSKLPGGIQLLDDQAIGSENISADFQAWGVSHLCAEISLGGACKFSYPSRHAPRHKAFSAGFKLLRQAAESFLNPLHNSHSPLPYLNDVKSMIFVDSSCMILKHGELVQAVDGEETDEADDEDDSNDGDEEEEERASHRTNDDDEIGEILKESQLSEDPNFHAFEEEL